MSSVARLLSEEFFHDTPNGRKLAACMIKHGAFRHILSLREPRPPIPMQWVISAGRPRGGMKGLWLRPMTSWPSGIYKGPPLLWTRLVVVSELPVARNTLRLMGDGAVLRRALAELKALPADAPERTLALPILLRFRLDVPTDPSKQTRDDKEFLVQTQDIVDTWRQEAVQEGVKQGLQEGVERGVACSLIDFYEARFGTMPEDLRAVIEDTHDQPTLRAWVKLVGTGGAHSIAAVIRAFLPS
jgi:hypothetical protein